MNIFIEISKKVFDNKAGILGMLSVIFFVPMHLSAVSNTVVSDTPKQYLMIESITGVPDQKGNYLLEWNISPNYTNNSIYDYRVEHKRKADVTFTPIEYQVVSYTKKKGTTLIDSKNFKGAYDFRVAPIDASGLGNYSSTISLTFSGVTPPLPPDPIPEPKLPFDPSTMNLVLQNGFAGTTEIIATKIAQTDKLIGADTTFPKPNDWVLDFEANTKIGVNIIQYEGGTENQRSAKIISEPGNPSNKVLEYWLSEPNVLNGSGAPLKGRVQNTLVGNTNVREVYEKVRLYIDPSFAALKNYPVPVTWFTISEWWNNAGWTKEAYPFRMSVNLVKPGITAGSPFYLSVHGQTLDVKTDRFTTVWESKNTTFEVPFGTWMTLEYYVKEGDSTNGRFYLAITPDEGKKQVVLDVKNYTYHPSDPNPDGIAHIHTMKMYTGKALIEYMKSQGKSLRLFWDDFQFTIAK